MSAKYKVLNQLEDLGENTLKADLDNKSYDNFSYNIMLLFFKDFEMLLTFICGFVANLPISVLFNILTFSNVDFCNTAWIIYFIIYVMCLISTILLTISSFAFTIRYVKIKSRITIPARIRKCITKNGKKNHLTYLKWQFVWIIISGLVFILSIITLFVINTFFLG